MTTKKVGADAFIDQGWAAFAITHQLKIGQFHAAKHLDIIVDFEAKKNRAFL
jgi:hypothetical protein